MTTIPRTKIKKKKPETETSLTSLNQLLERHGVTAITDGTGGLLLCIQARSYATSTQESQNTFPNQNREFHLANSMAGTLYELNGELETLMQELDLTAASHFDESVALNPFLEIEASIE